MEATKRAPIGRVLPESDGGLVPFPHALRENARQFEEASKSKNTRRAYAADWRGFNVWCETYRKQSLPASPETVSEFLAARAKSGVKASTISRALVAISFHHKEAGLRSPRESPKVRKVLQGIRRTLGTAPRQAKPLLPSDLKRILGDLPAALIGYRDAALLTLGFAGGFRRSELADLDLADLDLNSEGMAVHLRRSKTDQEGKGRDVGIPYGGSDRTCPVRCVTRWVELAGIKRGPLFRSVSKHGRVSNRALNARSISKIIKRVAGRSNFDAEKLSGHSLRAGLVTAAAKAGKSIPSIQRQTGHRSVAMVERYIRLVTVFEDNAFQGLSL